MALLQSKTRTCFLGLPWSSCVSPHYILDIRTAARTAWRSVRLRGPTTPTQSQAQSWCVCVCDSLDFADSNSGNASKIVEEKLGRHYLHSSGPPSEGKEGEARRSERSHFRIEEVCHSLPLALELTQLSDAICFLLVLLSLSGAFGSSILGDRRIAWLPLTLVPSWIVLLSCR